MSVEPSKNGLELPEALQTQLHKFRRSVWLIKSIEAICGALFGVIVSYMAVFGLDRMIDTPTSARLAIFLVAVLGCATVPIYLHRWIWQHRRFEQLARLVSRKLPLVGDPLLGIIELVRSESEQARSRGLVAAAIQQVAIETNQRDLQVAIPNPRHRFWAWMAAIPTAAAITVMCLFPAAAANAWARFAAPWRAVPRYTFTAVEQLPQKLVIAHGEPISLTVALMSDSHSRPSRGTLQIGTQHPIFADLREGKYEFNLPAQIESNWLSLQIGDSRQIIQVVPMLRPEVTAVVAEIQLPDYLHRPQSIHKDVRGGAVSILTGSVATFTVTANRKLSSGQIDDASAHTSGSSIVSDVFRIESSRKVLFQWKDEFGLGGLEPFTLNVTARDDEPPSLSCEDLPRQRVVLDSETLTFKVRAQDDFGIKVVGIEWQKADKTVVTKSAKGERILGAGSYDKEIMELSGTFCARNLEIEPQPLNVRLFVEDYLPGRPRTYSPPYLLYILNADQHAVWITEQLNKWHRQSLEVRDRELQLHHTNQELRLLSEEELDQPENRRRIEAQSTAERANGRRLSGLVTNGEELVRQAMRNPDFGVGHLEKWAEMLQILKDISANRMPNVADLLKQSSQAPALASNSSSKSAPSAGQIKDTKSAGDGSKPGESKAKSPVPMIADRESSQQPLKPSDPSEDPPKKESNPRLTLPVTTIASGNSKKQPSPPPGEKLDEAIVAQQDLLAEFDKIAEELNKVLANLEGSTLVKRLKSASRQQYVVAGKLNDQIGGTFGLRNKTGGAAKVVLEDLARLEAKYSQDLSNIMDDMQAYFIRRRMQKFKRVLDEMRDQDAIGSLRQLGDDLKSQTGLSMAQAEFWSDTMDRWADDLVDAGNCGKCPGCKSKSSLPPSIVLEAMHILEAEVNLREETRVGEQSRAAISTDDYGKLASQLSATQDALSDRVAKLVVRIKELPDAETEFGKEIALLTAVERVMTEAAEILDRPETGPAAIAAETEAIELLLQSKRINPKGGGGGGSSPGGGGSGTTSDAALALVGSGVNEKEVREDRGITQVTGETGAVLPEEFRAGLDEYFNRLERDGSK